MFELAFIVFDMFEFIELLFEAAVLTAVLLAEAAVLLADAAFELAAVAAELAFEAAALAFEAAALAFLAVFVALLLVAGSQANPKAPNANKPDNAIIFFISNSPVFFFKDYLDFYSKLRLNAILLQVIYFWNIGQYKSLFSFSQLKKSQKSSFFEFFFTKYFDFFPPFSR